MFFSKPLLLAALVTLAAFGVQADESAASELRFSDFFQLPIGPHGLAPSPRLLALDRRPVTISGYMVASGTATPGSFILAPLPIKLGEEDENLADDLPVSIVDVYLAPSYLVLQPISVRLWLTGMLQLGPRETVEGRRSFVHLQLDAAQSAALVSLQPSLSARQP